jgi:hypothetical protein
MSSAPGNRTELITFVTCASELFIFVERVTMTSILYVFIFSYFLYIMEIFIASKWRDVLRCCFVVTLVHCYIQIRGPLSWISERSYLAPELVPIAGGVQLAKGSAYPNNLARRRRSNVAMIHNINTDYRWVRPIDFHRLVELVVRTQVAKTFRELVDHNGFDLSGWKISYSLNWTTITRNWTGGSNSDIRRFNLGQ